MQDLVLIVFLVHELINKGKLLIISESEDCIVRSIKSKINDVIKNDIVTNERWNGHKFKHHSAWTKLDNLLIKINHIRQRNWYFKKLEI